MTNALPADCRRVLLSVSAYLDGDLDAASCEVIQSHCRQCPNCASEIAKLEETVGVCRQAGRLPVPDVIRERARDRVRRLLDAE